MLDDVRNHDPKPSAEERLWLATNLGGLSRFALMAGLAAAIGLSASVILEHFAATPTVASAR